MTRTDCKISHLSLVVASSDALAWYRALRSIESPVLKLGGIYVPPTVILAVFRYRLNTYGRQAFSVAGPTVWNSLPDFIRDPAISADCLDVCLKRICSLDTSAFSALEFLDDNHAI